MLKNAYLTEFSFSGNDSIDSVLKSHLLSNEKLIIPAATVKNSSIGKIISSNISSLGSGPISIAHGSDSSGLTGYLDKYPEINSHPNIVELFSHFDKNQLCSVYHPENTIIQFNKLMRKCASGEILQFNELFSNKDICERLYNFKGLFNLNDYFSVIKYSSISKKEKERLYAHAGYFYNYFGSFSTNSCNTISLENTTNFDYIGSGYKGADNKNSELNILISCALDLTDGIEDFSFIESLNSDFFDKLSYQDIIEIRKSWLHSEIINKYSKIVQECSNSYLKMSEGSWDSAVQHLEAAFEIRQQIVEKVSLEINSEIRAYKLHRFSRFVADTAISTISFLSGIDFLKTVIQGIYSATTEVAVLTNREKQLKKLVGTKLSKIKKARNKADTHIGGKSMVAEYLRMIENRLET